MLCPCKECNKRNMACHSSCEKYRDYRVEYDKIKKKIDDERAIAQSLRSYDIDCINKSRKRNNR